MKFPKEARYWCTLVVLLFLVYMADKLTTAEVSVGPLYLFAVGYGAWYLGKVGGLVSSVTCVILWILVDIQAGTRYSQGWVIWELAFTRLVTYVGETYFLTLYRSTLEAHRRRLAMMEQVLAVCPGCGRIGPQEGGWRRAEELQQANRDRYKLCPTCVSMPSSHATANSARSEHA